MKVKRLPEYRLEVDPENLVFNYSAPARFASILGVESRAERPAMKHLPPAMLDDQTEITRMAVEAKRFAVWSDCGLGKTFIELEFARQVVHLTGGRVLIVTLPEVISQFFEEATKFYGDALPLVHLESREAMKAWCATGVSGQSECPKCKIAWELAKAEFDAGGSPPSPAAVCTHEPHEPKIAITNYEKFNHDQENDQVVNECRRLAGFILDESSRLKSGGGKQKWAIIKSARGIEFKLSCTATPAPNDTIEFASQASFLEKLRDENEIIWTYFTRNSKTHRWEVKQHALKAFFEFMAGWSIYVRDPRRYGWRMNVEPPPLPTQIVHEIPMTQAQRDAVLEVNQKISRATGEDASMFADRERNAISSIKFSQIAKGFIYESGGEDDDDESTDKRAHRLIESAKPVLVVKLAQADSAANLPVIVWTEFDAESELLGKLIPAATVLTGKTPKAKRAAIIADFKASKIPVLITRAKMLGYGMNLQACGSMIFSGWTFSYEQFYQAVRRAYRHGQTRSVRVHIPIIRELEGQMWDTICRKDGLNERAIEEMEVNYIKAREQLMAAA